MSLQNPERIFLKKNILIYPLMITSETTIRKPFHDILSWSHRCPMEQISLSFQRKQWTLATTGLSTCFLWDFNWCFHLFIFSEIKVLLVLLIENIFKEAYSRIFKAQLWNIGKNQSRISLLSDTSVATLLKMKWVKPSPKTRLD